MKRVVIDTNILISSTLSSEGSPAKIMNLVSDKQIQLFLCAEILDEYKRVLAYEKLNISLQMQEKVMAAIEKLGIIVEPALSEIPLPDETDRIFYDTAISSESILITGNSKHYPSEPIIMTPSDFLIKFEQKN